MGEDDLSGGRLWKRIGSENQGTILESLKIMTNFQIKKVVYIYASPMFEDGEKSCRNWSR